jgi:hypothetical protein
MLQTEEVIILLFDVIGLSDSYFEDRAGTLDRLWQWQNIARDRFPFSQPNAAVKTLADTVWARIPLYDGPAAELAVAYAILVMRAARDAGFANYFGVLTRGLHSHDVFQRTLVTGGDGTDIRQQHIDMISEPHMRAAIAEKWSAYLDREGQLPVPSPSVWVGADVIEPRDLTVYLSIRQQGVVPKGRPFDLKQYPRNGRPWSFAQSVFQAIGLP